MEDYSIDTLADPQPYPFHKIGVSITNRGYYYIKAV